MEGSLKKLGSGVEDVLTQLGQFLIPVLTRVVEVVADVVGYFDKNRTAAIALGVGVGAIVAVLGTFAIATGVAKLATITQTVAMGAWGAATAVWSGITTAATAVMGAFDAVMDANPIALIVLAIVGLVAVFVLLVTHLKEVGQILGVVFGWFKAIPKEILGVFVGAVTWLFGIGKDIVTGLFNGVKNIWTTVTGWLGGIGKLITTAIGNLGTLLYNIGKSIITGLFNGIKAIWKDVTGFIGSIGSWISKHKGPLEADAVLLTPHGMAIMNGLHAGLKAGIPPILSTLSNLSGQMGSALGSGPSLSMTGSASLGARTSLAGAGASGAGGGVTFAPVYNLNVAGDVSPQTVQLLDAKIRQHDQQLYSQFQASR
jgi:phage-related protein